MAAATVVARAGVMRSGVLQVPPGSVLPSCRRPVNSLGSSHITAPSEGKWQDVVFTKGLPAVRITYLRPDDGHTSYLAAVMWLDPKLLTGRLHEGSTDPGGTWSTPDRITPALATTVAAAMPGGFRTNGGPVGNRGGYYD